jgi:peptidase C13-like protein
MLIGSMWPVKFSRGLKPPLQAKACSTFLRLIALFVVAAVAARAESYYLVVAGLGGEAEYEQRFTGWASDLTKLLKTEPNSKVETLSGKDATKANIEAKMREVAAASKPDDEFVALLIGHGSFDEQDYKFNIPGPDITAKELAALLDKIQAKQAVILMTSSSGGAIPVLQKPKRVIVTATKSGTEKNATIFARYFIEAMRDKDADTDKSEILTVQEAFHYAEQKTAKFFETQKRLATEHALIEDSGKGEGVKDPSPENGEGLVAGRFALLHLGSVASLVNDPEKQKLLKHKEELEASIDELKYEKASMPLPQYRQQMQEFLLDLAKTQEALDK